MTNGANLFFCLLPLYVLSSLFNIQLMYSAAVGWLTPEIRSRPLLHFGC